MRKLLPLISVFFLTGCFYLANFQTQMDPFPRLHYENALAKARQGDVEAQSQVAQKLRFGCHHPGDYMPWTPPCDKSAAFKWTYVAAQNGDPNSQIVLGELYRSGEYTPQSWEEAYFWTRVTGHSNADIDQHLSEAKRLELDRRIAAWKPKDSRSSCLNNELGLDLCGGSHVIYKSSPRILNE